MTIQCSKDVVGCKAWQEHGDPLAKNVYYQAVCPPAFCPWCGSALIEPQEMIRREIVYPKPISVAPAMEQEYFLADPTNEMKAARFTWGGTSVEARWLRCGLIHLTEEAATIHGKVLRGE